MWELALAVLELITLVFLLIEYAYSIYRSMKAKNDVECIKYLLWTILWVILIKTA